MEYAVRAGQTTALLTGLKIDEAIARYSSTGRLTQVTDQLGSVIRQINEAGVTQSTTAYSPYGEAVTAGNKQGNSTNFTGRENDETGLYFYRARYFDPILKRWISEDPIGTAGGINLYAYVEGNPVNWSDPRGLDAPGCDGIPDILDSNCMLNMCAKHDQCYSDKICTALSWLLPLSECNLKCNLPAVGGAICAAASAAVGRTCVLKPDTTPRPDITQ